MKAVIMAGGKGTRIAELNAKVPKPMIPIAGKPVLEHQLEVLQRQGVNDITLVIGRSGLVIKDYFGDGSKIGGTRKSPVHITYIEETEPLGTAGALYYLRNLNEDFLLLNGDTIFDIDVERFYRAHKVYGGIATLFTHPNDHPFDSGIVVVNDTPYCSEVATDVPAYHSGGRVTEWLAKEDNRTWYKNRTNAGLHMLSPLVFERFSDLRKLDLDRDILRPMISEKTLFAYDSPEYVKDMGTPERYYEVENDILSDKPAAKNLAVKQKALFIDRDGTINKYVGFLREIDEFELIDDIIEITNNNTGETIAYNDITEFIKKANKSGYLVIVVTNQPVIARGEVTWEQLNKIHNKMETLLGERGAYVDDIFICPHHPDKGFPGERSEYKTVCNCRKPKPGLMLQAAAKYNIDLERSYMLGDSESDAEAGLAAGCRVLMMDYRL